MLRHKILIAVLLSFLPWMISSSVLPSQQTGQGDGVLHLKNIHLGEEDVITFKTTRGKFLERGVEKIQHILRDRTNDKEIEIAPELLSLLDKVQDHFGSRKIEVICGYRSPEFNAYLRKHGHRVGKFSYHMKGMAIDFRIPGVSSRKVLAYAKSLKAGGVGFYSHNDFIHMDVGPVRYW